MDSIGIWIWLSAYCVVNCLPNFEVSGLGKPSKKSRGVLFEFHLKFWNTNSIGIPVRSNIMYKVDRLLTGLTVQQKGTTELLDGILIKQLYV